MARELFRFIRGEALALDDFSSHGALGKRMKRGQGDPDALRRWNEGISVFDDFARACELASDLGFDWIATIFLEDAADFEVSQYGRDRHHYTNFGQPKELMALVSEVRPVPRAPGV